MDETWHQERIFGVIAAMVQTSIAENLDLLSRIWRVISRYFLFTFQGHVTSSIGKNTWINVFMNRIEAEYWNFLLKGRISPKRQNLVFSVSSVCSTWYVQHGGYVIHSSQQRTCQRGAFSGWVFGPGRVPKRYDGCSCSYMVLLPVFDKCLRLC